MGSPKLLHTCTWPSPHAPRVSAGSWPGLRNRAGEAILFLSSFEAWPVRAL